MAGNGLSADLHETQHLTRFESELIRLTILRVHPRLPLLIGGNYGRLSTA
jgi:hypothetical protein